MRQYYIEKCIKILVYLNYSIDYFNSINCKYIYWLMNSGFVSSANIREIQLS